MTVSRASRRARFLRGAIAAAAVAAALSATPTVPSQAQVGAPIQIGPPPANPQEEPAPPASGAPALTLPGVGAQPLQPPGISPAPEPVSPPSLTTSDGAITIDRLQRLTLDATGTLSPAIGGLAPNLWDGTPAGIAERLVALLPPTSDSQTLRDLGRRMLLTSGPTPPGIAPEGALLVQRATRLLEMGAIDDLAALDDRVPGHQLSLELSRPFAEAAFARGDDELACALFDRITDAATDAFWIKVAMVCDARAGRNAKVDFGARLLNELDDDDPLIIALAQAATSGQAGAEFLMGGAAPVHLALARIAGLKIKPNVSAIPSLPVLVGLARGAGAPAFAERLAAAEKAEQAGAIPPAEVTGLYGEVSVAVDSVDGAIAAAEADPGPLGRAILWRVAEAQTVPVARAQAITKAMEMAETDTAWRQTVRLFLPFLVTLAPGPDLDWFAEQAARGLISAGDVRAARPWIDRMRRLSATGNTEAADAWLRLWATARIAGGDAITPFNDTAVARWWEKLRSIDSAQASIRGATALALMTALGDPVGGDAWRGLATVPPLDVHAVPGTAYAFAIRAAADNGRLAETVILSIAALGETAVGEIAIPALADIVRALRVVGLEAEARRFAAEVALAHGL